jgi:shikimate kinase
MSRDYKAEQSERAWQLFDSEGYAAFKAKEKALINELFAAQRKICPECGGVLRVKDSYLHSVATRHCICGYVDYE